MQNLTPIQEEVADVQQLVMAAAKGESTIFLARRIRNRYGEIEARRIAAIASARGQR